VRPAGAALWALQRRRGPRAGGAGHAGGGFGCGAPPGAVPHAAPAR